MTTVQILERQINLTRRIQFRELVHDSSGKPYVLASGNPSRSPLCSAQPEVATRQANSEFLTILQNAEAHIWIATAE